MMKVLLLSSFVGVAHSFSAPLAAPRCCWSKWGDQTTCGGYPAGASGGKCTTDWSKTCSGNSDCHTQGEGGQTQSTRANR